MESAAGKINGNTGAQQQISSLEKFGPTSNPKASGGKEEKIGWAGEMNGLVDEGSSGAGDSKKQILAVLGINQNAADSRSRIKL
jgi:hypothetical protein